MNRLAVAAALALGSVAAPVCAKDSLGVFGAWATFRDPSPARCYAIAKPRGAGDAYASVGTWPGEGVRGQIHFRLSRAASSVRLSIGSRTFELTPQGRDAWAADKSANAAMLAAMRSAGQMRVVARAPNGARLTDRYDLEGAATAMDASIVGCATRR
jgi:hypothetical protein